MHLKHLIGILGLLWLPGKPGLGVNSDQYRLEQLQKKIRTASGKLMDTQEISYIYGGSLPGGVGRLCNECTTCLKLKKPKPKKRMISCPDCRFCGLDCSHFTKLVFEKAGLFAPYLTTHQMLSLKPTLLFQNYHLLPVRHLDLARSGDLLVYKGHVVILEKKTSKNKGDIIHATGGKAIKRPAQGIQRETNVNLNQFRGPLRRILRHRKLFIAADLKPAINDRKSRAD